MHLYGFLVVVVSLACGSLPAVEIEATRAIGATIGMITAWILLSHVGARVVAKQVESESLDPKVGADWLDIQLEAFRWLGLGVATLCLGGFGFASVLKSMPLLEHSMFLQAVGLMAPAVLIAAGTWSAEHRYGVLLGYTDRTLGNHLSSIVGIFRGSLAWLVIPILILLGAGDLLSLLPLSPETITAITAISVAVFIPFLLPWMIRYVFKTEKLDVTTESWVQQLMSAAGLHKTKAVRWDTSGRSFNALVAGFVPPLRTLLISDRLLDELPRDQVAMVILHEAAHLRRRHVPMRMLAVIPAWAIGAAVTRVAGETSWAVPVGTVIGILMTMIILRTVAYRTEFDADVTACRMATKMPLSVEDVPRSYAAAAESLSDALQQVTREHPSSRKATWLHPSVADRVARMRRHRDDPQTKKTTASTIANPA